MTARVLACLRALRAVADRPDPTVPMPLAEIAAHLDLDLGGSSRLCAEMAESGLIARSGEYGAYALGPRALALSGRAASPLARTVRYELTRAAQATTETVFLAVPDGDGARIIAVVDSWWTLHTPSAVGELITDPQRASLRALFGPAGADPLAGDGRAVESQVGPIVETAVRIHGTDGRHVAVLAVSQPVYRAGRGRPRARRALADARRGLERAFSSWHDAPRRVSHPQSPTSSARAVEAITRILDHLASAPDTPSGIAAGTGLRADRVRRLLVSAEQTGLVALGTDSGRYRLDWLTHSWHRAAITPVLVRDGGPLVAETAQSVGACAFLTVLKGMRSYTLVEALEVLGGSLIMAPWLGRPHPIVGSDGGPTLVMDFTHDQLVTLFPPRHSPAEFEKFTARVAQVTSSGVLSVDSIDEFGITSVSAPVRDAAGMVAAAACIVGITEDLKPRLAEIERAALALASTVGGRLDPVL